MVARKVLLADLLGHEYDGSEYNSLFRVYVGVCIDFKGGNHRLDEVQTYGHLLRVFYARSSYSFLDDLRASFRLNVLP